MKIYGKLVDKETRCVHYHGDKDIIALQCAACLKFYPCYQCHNEEETHLFQPWLKTQFDQQAIFCGHCRTQLSIHCYLQADECPQCHHPFNPNCAKHYSLYFQIDEHTAETA